MTSPYLDRPPRSANEIADDLKARLAQATPGSAEHRRLAASLATIEWADASWNPIRARDLGPVGTGPGIGTHCEIVSPGCEHCYAQAINKRLGTHRPYLRTSRDHVSIYLDDKALTQPLRWRRPRMIFAGSMTDLFGEWVGDDMLDRIFAVMALCPQHIFQVLTKRAERMRDYCLRTNRLLINWPLPNVWLGVSVEDQRRADERIPLLLDTPAAVRWVSAEPLLGGINLTRLTVLRVYGSALLDATTGLLHDYHGNDLGKANPQSLDWVVCGGESGPAARPMHPDWARSLRDQCTVAGVPFFFKQWGEYVSRKAGNGFEGYIEAGGSDICVCWPDGTVGPGHSDLNKGRGWPLDRVGKRAAGRLLDGCEWNEYPAFMPGAGS